MKRLVIVVAAALLIAAVVATGCGKKKTTQTANSAKQILDRSQKASQDIKSLKASGSYKMQTPQSEVKETQFSFTLEANLLTETDYEAKVIATDAQGQQGQVYVSGGYIYSYSPSRGWEKQSLESINELGGIGMLTPSQLTELSKYAENVKKLPDEGDNYVISFDVGTKFFEETLSAAEAQSSAPGTEDQQGASDLIDLAKGMLKDLKMNLVLKINKTTYYPSEAGINMSIKAVPVIGDTSLQSTIAFSDYNQPVTVTLPAEAQSAKEMPAGVPSGIPGLPGLGL